MSELPQAEVIQKFRELVELVDEMPAQLALGLNGEIAWLPIGDAPVEPREVLFAVAGAVQAGALPRPDWVLFASETYMATAPEGEADALMDVERHELRDRHAIGMSGVGEALVVHFVAHDGTSWAALQPFTRKAAIGAVAWGKLDIADAEVEGLSVGGPIPEALADIVGIGAQE